MRLLVSLCLSAFAAAAWASECPPLIPDAIAKVKTIVDGDTLQLTDNRRVRLIAVNTPELGRDDQAAQPLAKEAQIAARNFLQDAGTIGLHYGQRRTDRYGRWLAHINHPQRGSLEVRLVETGLAFPIAVPPDTRYTACLRDIADRARQQKRGVWSHDYWRPIPSTNSKQFTESFRRVCGRVSKVDRAGPLWVELQGDLVIRINRDDWPYFADSTFDLDNAEAWLGKQVELWGWLQDRSEQKNIIQRGFKPWSIQARSPYVMRWIDQCI